MFVFFLGPSKYLEMALERQINGHQLLSFIDFSLNERLSEYASGHANIMNRLDQLEQEKEDIARIKEERDEIIAKKEELEATIEKLTFEQEISRQDKM